MQAHIARIYGPEGDLRGTCWATEEAVGAVLIQLGIFGKGRAKLYGIPFSCSSASSLSLREAGWVPLAHYRA